MTEQTLPMPQALIVEDDEKLAVIAGAAGLRQHVARKFTDCSVFLG